eukprot:gene6017-29484_t
MRVWVWEWRCGCVLGGGRPHHPPHLSSRYSRLDDQRRLRRLRRFRRLRRRKAPPGD